MKLFPCIVVAASSPAGAASGITYTVDITMPTGVVRRSGIAPDSNRPPETVDTRAASVGTCYLAFEKSPGVLAHPFQEWPDFAACPGAAT